MVEVEGLVGDTEYTMVVVASLEGCGEEECKGDGCKEKECKGEGCKEEEECSARSKGRSVRVRCGHTCADGSCVNR